jgi:3-dehydroquinate synthase
MRVPLNISETRSSTLVSGRGSWKWLNDRVVKLQEQSVKIFILVDENTRRHCLPVFLKENPGLKNPEILTIAPGEISKSPETVFSLWNLLLEKMAVKNSLLINLGGGVVCDTGGFVASTFKRGIQFINVPTTMMAMADAGAGGKTAINLGNIKNAIGSFYLPQATVIWPGFLKTLEKSEILSGLAEVFKIAVVADPLFWDQLVMTDWTKFFSSAFDEKKKEKIIARAAELKSAIVEKDFSDTGHRAILNFGHTFGHAFEALSLQRDKKPLSHGRAVAAGILCESYLSMEYCGLLESEFEKIAGFFAQVFGYYPFSMDDFDEILMLMGQDKKNRNRTINLTLIKKPGLAVIKQPCSRTMIGEALDFYQTIPEKYIHADHKGKKTR